MKGSLGLIFTILLIFSGNFSPYLANEIKDEKGSKSDLSTDYLKKTKNEDYIIGPGDKLLIRVSKEYPELTTITNIDGEGTVYLPKLKRVFVDGLTIEELTKLLDEAYQEIVNFSEMEISIIQYRPIKVFLEGEFINPGIYTLDGFELIGNNQETNSEFLPIFSENTDFDLSDFKEESNKSSSYYFPTVYDAIRASGGITQYTDLENIEIIRKNSISDGGGKKKAVLNFKKLIEDGDSSQNIRIYDGDIIISKRNDNQNLKQLNKAITSNLNPKYISVYVTGRVNEPGRKVIPKSSSLNDALDISGGPKILKGKIRFIRFNNNGSFEKRKIRYSNKNERGSYRNPILMNGDLVVVDSGFFANSNEIINEITSPLSGLFSAYGLIKVLSE